MDRSAWRDTRPALMYPQVGTCTRGAGIPKGLGQKKARSTRAAVQLLALAILLALPAVALAQPIEITGTDTLTFMWAPASGPVVGYEAKLVYLDGTESTAQVVGLPPQSFAPRKGIAFRLVVRGCREGPVCDGPWSEPSFEWKLCPLAADVDCNLAVGMSDFGLLLRAWGERVDE